MSRAAKPNQAPRHNTLRRLTPLILPGLLASCGLVPDAPKPLKVPAAQFGTSGTALARIGQHAKLLEASTKRPNQRELDAINATFEGAAPAVLQATADRVSALARTIPALKVDNQSHGSRSFDAHDGSYVVFSREDDANNGEQSISFYSKDSFGDTTSKMIIVRTENGKKNLIFNKDFTVAGYPNPTTPEQKAIALGLKSFDELRIDTESITATFAMDQPPFPKDFSAGKFVESQGGFSDTYAVSSQVSLINDGLRTMQDFLHEFELVSAANPAA